jgi:uncharacterized membrane protein YfhO
VRVADYRSGEIRLSCEVSRPSILLWNSRFDAGWKAEVDGHPAALFPANFMMTGLELSAGSHEIMLSYNPQSRLQKISFGMAVLGLLFVPASLLSLTRRRKVS